MCPADLGGKYWLTPSFVFTRLGAKRMKGPMPIPAAAERIGRVGAEPVAVGATQPETYSRGRALAGQVRIVLRRALGEAILQEAHDRGRVGSSGG